MKALLVGQADGGGGAAIAAGRLLHALPLADVEPSMLVLRRTTDDPKVTAVPGPGQRIRLAARRQTANLLLKLRNEPSQLAHSMNVFPTGLHRHINRFSTDVVHLHWIGAETIRIEELARIDKPIVWTLHDEWAYCGTEHYANAEDQRFALGYCSVHQSRFQQIFDVDAWTWQRKRQAWTNLDLTLVCPSRWLADRARSSVIFRSKRIEYIPNTLPLEIFQPGERAAARDRLKLPQDRLLIGFGAFHATRDPRKGFGLLHQALELLVESGRADMMDAVIFGTDHDPETALRMPIHSCGLIRGDEHLAHFYQACDVFVCPSTQENLPNTVMEAMACGVPCVAFRTGGLSDLIDPQCGYLAEPFDPHDLADGIAFCTAPGLGERMGKAGKTKVAAHFSEASVAQRHRCLYEDVIRTAVHQRRVS